MFPVPPTLSWARFRKHFQMGNNFREKEQKIISHFAASSHWDETAAALERTQGGPGGSESGREARVDG